jgi:hypothetical protein
MHMKGMWLWLSLFMLCNVASAEVYKWVDDKGEVHFGDSPKGSQDAKISIEENAAAHTDTAQPTQADTQKLIDSMEQSRKQRAKQRQQQRAAQRKQDEKCLKERNKLRKLETKMQKHYSEFSNDRPASYQHLEAEAAERKKYLQQYCN